MIPTHEQLAGWTNTTRRLATSAERLGLYHDLYEVERRINAESGYRTLQGGCAMRVMRFASAVRALTTADLERLGVGEGYIKAVIGACLALARELIAHENIPSPGWKTMCEEGGWDYTPAGANDY